MLEREMNELYEKFYPKIASTSRSVSNIFGVEYDDILGQANLIFVECCKDYQGGLACFHTYLDWQLKNLKAYAKRLSDGTVNEFPENVLYNTLSVKDNFIAFLELEESISRLSPLAQQIVEFAYNPVSFIDTLAGSKKEWTKEQKKDIDGSLLNPQITKKRIMTYLMNVRNYTRDTCERAFYEIQEAL